MERIVQLIKQYWSILSYLFFGVVTTAVNMAVYYVCYHLCGLSSDGSTIIAWVIAVLTAFDQQALCVWQSRLVHEGAVTGGRELLWMPPGIGPGRATFDAHYGRDAGAGRGCS